MSKKILVAALSVLMLLSALAGCATKPVQAPSAPATETPATSAATGGESTDALRFMDVVPSPDRQAYYEKMFAQFEQETGIKVTYESVPWDDAANKYTVLGASNSLPDVMTTWPGWLGQFTSAGWVLPLNDYVAGTEEEYTALVRNMIWANEEDLYGAIYTIPDGIMAKGIFVRSDWAEEAGLNLDPKKGWTYDEYFDAVGKLTDPEQKRYGVSFRGARGAFDPLLTYLVGMHGGRLYDDDGTILINDEKSLEGFKKWGDLYLNGYAPKDSINWGFTEMVDNFTGGLTGTLSNDSEVAATCYAQMEEGTWMVMPMPTSEDGKIYNNLGSPYAYSISAHSKSPDTAWKLIEFLSQPEHNIEYCQMGGLIPIKTDVGDDPMYGEDGPYATFVQQLNDPNLMFPCFYGPFDYTDIHQGMLHEELQKYLLGEIDAETALGTITGELESRMKQYLADNPGSTVEKPKAIG